MKTSLNEAPRGLRTAIGFFGKRNSGKSSLVNAIVGSEVSLVSEIAGTTTDPVYKNMELHPLGAIVLIDTAGYDDVGHLGELRVKATKDVINKCDIGIIVVECCDENTSLEQEILDELKAKNTPTLVVATKNDLKCEMSSWVKRNNAISVSSYDKTNIGELKEKIARISVDTIDSTVAHLVKSGDVVVLVTPIDKQAPKGRMILPEVQVLRDLLDIHAIVNMVQTDELEQCLKSLIATPSMIVTDSQAFVAVEKLCPSGTKLTSFSVLMARFKGDIKEFVSGANAIASLKQKDNVLILEACTHNPLDGDIGREKIPNMLRKRVSDLNIEVVAGKIPEDLSKYKLIIHCGGCMITRKNVLDRMSKAQDCKIPITNYGIAIAYMNNILDKVVY